MMVVGRFAVVPFDYYSRTRPFRFYFITFPYGTERAFNIYDSI